MQPSTSALSAARTVESAQAALQLGPVEYVCNACGETHVSNQPLPRHCFSRRIDFALASARETGEYDAAGRAMAALLNALLDAAPRQSVAWISVAWIMACLERPASILAALCDDPRLHDVADCRSASRKASVRLALFGSPAWLLMSDPSHANQEVMRIVRQYLCDAGRSLSHGQLHMHVMRDQAASCGAEVLAAYDALCAELIAFM